LWSSQSPTKAAFYLNASRSGTDDIMSHRFYEGLYRMIYIREDGTLDSAQNMKSQDIEDWMGGPSQGVSIAADTLAKCFHSTIMTDLGQTQYQPNIFANTDLRNAFLSNLSSVVSMTYNNDGLFSASRRNFETLYFDASLTGQLSVLPSVLSSKYLCQVPRQKPIGELIVSILIADLVLLQALWKITMWVAKWLIESRDVKANWCQGCIRQTDRVKSAINDRSLVETNKHIVHSSETEITKKLINNLGDPSTGANAQL